MGSRVRFSLQRRRHPVWRWFAALPSAEREAVLRERVPSGAIAVLRLMVAKHHEARQGGRHCFFNDVTFTADAPPHFGTVSPEQKASVFWSFAPSRPAAAEAGDVHTTLWDADDAALVDAFFVFSSVRTSELDAWALKGLSLPRLLRLLLVCSRGRFLTACPTLPQKDSQASTMCSLSMPWFENRSSTALATHVAHLVELKLWREYIASHAMQAGPAIASIPRPRFTLPTPCDARTRERTAAQNEAFEKEVRALRRDRKSLQCRAPIARASEDELARHFLSLAPEERLELLCGMMKDAVCSAVHLRVGVGEEKDTQGREEPASARPISRPASAASPVQFGPLFRATGATVGRASAQGHGQFCPTRATAPAQARSGAAVHACGTGGAAGRCACACDACPRDGLARLHSFTLHGSVGRFSVA